MSGLQSIYILTSRLQTQQKKMDSVAVNVANANTPGFKRQGVDFQTLVGGRDNRPAGKFVVDRGYKTSFTQGTINQTDNPFDAALIGDGFFAVASEVGGTPNYTRDGHFNLSPNGDLVTGTGQAVLDDGGAPINLPPNQRIEIEKDGTITADGIPVTRLGVFQFDPTTPMIRIGDNQFRVEGNIQGNVAQNVQVLGGALESSNVDPVLETVRMTEVSHAYQGAANLLSTLEDLQTRAIRELPAAGQ